MSTDGPRYPGTCSDDSAVGTITWSNPGNIASSDNSYATCSSTAGAYTHYLKGVNLGFAIPTGATINGVTLEIERKANYNLATNFAVRDYVLKLVVGGSVSGNSKAATGTNWPTSDATASYGGATDLWGCTLDADAVNASDFGFVLQARIYTVSTNVIGSVDMVRITVDYTEGGAAGQPMQARATLVLGMRRWQPGRR